MIIEIFENLWIDLTHVSQYQAVGDGYVLDCGLRTIHLNKTDCKIQQLAIKRIANYLTGRETTGVAYLKRLMLEDELTQLKLGRVAKIEPATLSRILSQDLAMSASVKLRLAKYFNVPPSNFN